MKGPAGLPIEFEAGIFVTTSSQYTQDHLPEI